MLSCQKHSDSTVSHYPYGMLMPGRYVQDTSAKCMTVSANKWMVTPETTCKDSSDTWPWFPVELNNWVAIQIVNGTPQLDFYRDGAVLVFNIPKGNNSLPNQHTLNLEIEGDMSVGVAFILISNSDSGNFTYSQPIIQGQQHRTLSMDFLPYGYPNEKILLYIAPLSPMGATFLLKSICLTEEKYSSQSVPAGASL